MLQKGPVLTRPTDSILAALSQFGLLLEQDKTLPSAVGILTGESLRGSWWGHPKGRIVFAALSELAEHPDVLFTKLLYGKVTLIYRPLWPAVLGVGRAREPWQLKGLSGDARRLLGRLDRGDDPVRAAGKGVKELETRLLATARAVHTDSGRHELVLESWRAWSKRVGCRAAKSVPRSRQALEQAALALGATALALPWQLGGPRAKRRR